MRIARSKSMSSLYIFKYIKFIYIFFYNIFNTNHIYLDIYACSILNSINILIFYIISLNILMLVLNVNMHKIYNFLIHTEFSKQIFEC